MLGWIGSYLLVLRPVRTLVKSSARLAMGDLSTRTGLRTGEMNWVSLPAASIRWPSLGTARRGTSVSESRAEGFRIALPPAV